MQFEVLCEASDKGKRLDVFLTEKTGQTRSSIQKIIEAKRVMINGKTAEKTGTTLANGDLIRAGLKPLKNPQLRASDLKLEILYEDADLLVINKPAGIVVHPDSTGHHDNTIVNALLAHLEKEVKVEIKGSKKRPTVPEDSAFLKDCDGFLRPGIVHRLDKDTSGALILAKNTESLTKLSKSFEKRQVFKVYQALIHGHTKTEAGRIDAPIQRSSKERKQMAIGGKGKSARTSFTVQERFASKNPAPLPCSLLDVKIETGRTHQIRVHLAGIGHPILGDSTYGRKDANLVLAQKTGLKRQFLHAHSLQFPHPRTGALITVEAPLPPDLQNTLNILRSL